MIEGAPETPVAAGLVGASLDVVEVKTSSYLPKSNLKSQKIQDSDSQRGSFSTMLSASKATSGFTNTIGTPYIVIILKKIDAKPNRGSE